MMYSDLRRMIFNVCSEEACNDEEIIFDDIGSTPESKPFEDRIDAGENPRAVVREFAKKIVDGRTWTVKVGGKSYQVRMTSNFKGEVASKVPIRMKQTVNPRQRKKFLSIAKKTIICLANLEKILSDGKKTRFITNDDRIKRGKIAHEGWRWIYARDISKATGAKGAVLVQMAFPDPIREAGRPNMVYNVAVKGNMGFPNRNRQFMGNRARSGEVTIYLD